jgi:phage recombination protein Bet
MTSEGRELITSAVDPVVSDAIAIYNRMAPLRDALGVKDLTDAELSLFAMVAQRSGLDPFAKQIYAIKRGGRVTFQTGIDGYRSTAARTGQYEGSSDPVFGEWSDTPFPHPESATVTVYRWQNGHRVEQTATAWWDEYYPGERGRIPRGPADVGYMWLTKPRVMIGKVAEAIGLRKAFPYVLNDLYIREEMEKAGPGDNPALVAAAQAPTARARLAARRVAMDAVEQPRAADGDSGEPIDPHSDGSIYGTVETRQEWLGDLDVHDTPNGPVIGFRLKDGRRSIKVQAQGDIAAVLAANSDAAIGQTVTCWGEIETAEFTPKGERRPVSYAVLTLSRIKGPFGEFPAEDELDDDKLWEKVPEVGAPAA